MFSSFDPDAQIVHEFFSASRDSRCWSDDGYFVELYLNVRRALVEKLEFSVDRAEIVERLRSFETGWTRKSDVARRGKVVKSRKQGVDSGG
jgi:hypothetical protein